MMRTKLPVLFAMVILALTIGVVAEEPFSGGANQPPPEPENQGEPCYSTNGGTHEDCGGGTLDFCTACWNHGWSCTASGSYWYCTAGTVACIKPETLPHPFGTSDRWRPCLLNGGADCRALALGIRLLPLAGREV